MANPHFSGQVFMENTREPTIAEPDLARPTAGGEVESKPCQYTLARLLFLVTVAAMAFAVMRHEWAWHVAGIFVAIVVYQGPLYAAWAGHLFFRHWSIWLRWLLCLLFLFFVGFLFAYLWDGSPRAMHRAGLIMVYLVGPGWLLQIGIMGIYLLVNRTKRNGKGGVSFTLLAPKDRLV